jgi:hypothetical protein
MTSPAPRPETILKLRSAVFPSFALLAGVQLDLFTPLKDGPMSAQQIAEALGINSAKLRPWLYELVVAGVMTVEHGRFCNTVEATHFLVRGQPTYLGGMYEGWLERWNAVLKTAETIRTGVAQARHDFSAMSPEEQESFFRAQHPASVSAGRDLVISI